LVAPPRQYEQEVAQRVGDFIKRWQDHCCILYRPRF
jgi:hypothetical protein